MSLLVTGATGFVGASLVRSLVCSGEEIHVFTRQASDIWRIKDVIDKVNRHDVDLRNAQAVENCISDIRPSIIYHLACYGGFACQNDPAAILDSNLTGTINLLRSCEKTGFDLFVNTGSSSEYGIKYSPIAESDLLEPLGDYAVAKAAATLFCRSEALLKELPVVTLRLFSPYGPWDDPKRLIPYVVSSLLTGLKPKLSNPFNVRDFIYIGDVINAYHAITSSAVIPGGIYNVGSGMQVNLGEVVSIISRALGDKVVPDWGVRENQRPEPLNWVADISSLKSQCDWQPSIGLEEGLMKTINWMVDNLQNYAIAN